MEITIEEKVMLTSWAIVYDNCEESRRLFAQKYNKEAPSRTTVSYWKNKLLETGNIVTERPTSVRSVTATGDDHKEMVAQAIDDEPTTSTRQMSEELDISRTSVRRTLKSEGYRPFKPLHSQVLIDGDDRRLEFFETMLAKYREDPALHRKLTFSDECVFHLAGHVNKRNVHYWRQENVPSQYEKLQHAFAVVS